MKFDHSSAPKPLVAAKKRIFRIIIGILLSVLPFIWIFRKIQPNELLSAVKSVSWWTVPLLCCIILTAMVLQGIRWWILIRAFSREMSFVQSLSLHFKTTFYSLFLPNSTVQEIVRSVAAVKHVGPVVSWSATWVNKMSGVLVSYTLSMYGVFTLSAGFLPDTIAYIIVALFLAMVVLVGFSFSKRMSRPFGKVFSRFIPQRFYTPFQEIRNGIYRFRNKKKEVALSVIVTFVVQVLLVFSVVMMIRGVTGSFFISECFAFIPLIEMISMAQPFTPNGVGVREALVALMFGHLKLSQEQLGIYIIISNLAVLLKLTGAIPVLFDTFSRNLRQSGRTRECSGPSEKRG